MDLGLAAIAAVTTLSFLLVATGMVVNARSIRASRGPSARGVRLAFLPIGAMLMAVACVGVASMLFVGAWPLVVLMVPVALVGVAFLRTGVRGRTE
jgi:phosphatidylglycerophosphate synthase